MVENKRNVVTKGHSSLKQQHRRENSSHNKKTFLKDKEKEKHKSTIQEGKLIKIIINWDNKTNDNGDHNRRKPRNGYIKPSTMKVHILEGKNQLRKR